MFAVLTFFFLLASLKTDSVLIAVFVLIFIALVLLAIDAQRGSAGSTQIGGWVAIGSPCWGWYHAAGDIINYYLRTPGSLGREDRRMRIVAGTGSDRNCAVH